MNFAREFADRVFLLMVVRLWSLENLKVFFQIQQRKELKNFLKNLLTILINTTPTKYFYNYD